MVGTVTVDWNADRNVYVTYRITLDGWYMTEVHVGWFDCEELPKKMIPGKAQEGFEGLFDRLYTVTIPQSDIGGKCCFGLHAVVEKPGGLFGLELALPDQVSMKVEYPIPGGPSYFKTTVFGDSVLDGIFEGWCVDTSRTITQNKGYTANVYSSYETLPDNTVAYPENLDLVNWILNQRYVGQPSPGCTGNYTYGDVQRAIWTLVDPNSTSGLGAWSQCRVDEILADAHSYGEGFEPGCGDVVAVILVPVSPGTAQTTIAQITLIDVGVACDSQEETAWGWGNEKFTRAWGWFFKCCCP